MTWFVDGRTFARKVKNPTYRSRSGSCYRSKSIECLTCGHAVQIDSAQEWPGLPTGVKFDPSDHEILEHLAAKVGIDNAEPHPLIDEFIPTLDGEDGICYTHPENLPGIKYDGSSAHFFHRPARAYTTGTRKRRKIQSERDDGMFGGEMRWHKTGKTRLVVENGKQLGCKKIMVLYASFQKKGKPEKTNWVMHQYHLGVHEEEKEGELVVSKVFYQTQLRQSVGGHRGDSGCYKWEEMGMDEAATDSVPQSGASAISSGIKYRGAPMTPQIPAPPRPQAGKQHKGQHRGLFEAISEEVDRITASLNTNSLKRNWSEDQSTLATEVTSITADCRFDVEEQGAGPSLCQGVMDQGNQDTCNSLERPKKYQMGTGQPSCEVHSMLKDISLNDTGQNFCSAVVDISLTLDNMLEEELKSDPPLENIVLDTPPDLLLESLLNSQDSLDWLEKRRFPSECQRGSVTDEEFDILGCLRDSQSSA